MVKESRDGSLAAIRKRTQNTRDVINGARKRQNYTIASPTQLDREALLGALDAVLDVVTRREKLAAEHDLVAIAYAAEIRSAIDKALAIERSE